MSMQTELALSPQDIAEHVWVQDGVHFGHPLTPLFASYMMPALTTGTYQAMKALNGPFVQFIGKLRDGHYYQAVIPRHGDPQQIEHEYMGTLESIMGRQQESFREWRDTTLMPLHNEIDLMVASITNASEAANALTRLQEIYNTFWDVHFRIVIPRMSAGFRFEETYKMAFPEANSAQAYELLLGLMNKSLETDRELSRLAQYAKTHPTVLSALSAPDIAQALNRDPETESFRQMLDTFLESYGWRSVDSHEFLHKTWREDPNYCLTIIKGFVEQNFDFDAHWEKLVSTRQQKVTDALSRITDPQIKEAFRSALNDAMDAWPIDEDHHFYIDAMLPARARHVCLKAADILVNNGTLPHHDAIFFLYLDEVLACLVGTPPPPNSRPLSRPDKLTTVANSP